jgi:CO dehydrogenase/acetyl-CoA synthase beta subunit
MFGAAAFNFDGRETVPVCQTIGCTHVAVVVEDGVVLCGSCSWVIRFGGVAS